MSDRRGVKIDRRDKEGIETIIGSRSALPFKVRIWLWWAFKVLKVEELCLDTLPTNIPGAPEGAREAGAFLFIANPRFKKLLDKEIEESEKAVAQKPKKSSFGTSDQP